MMFMNVKLKTVQPISAIVWIKIGYFYGQIHEIHINSLLST